MKSIKAFFRVIISQLMNPIVFLAGMVLLSIGIYKIFIPAMFIVDGCVLMAISIFGNEGKAK